MNCGRVINVLVIFSLCQLLNAQQSQRLTGTVIGTSLSLDEATGAPSTTVNTKWSAFDDDFSTYFSSYEASNTWIGLDLGEPHVITGVAWSARNSKEGPHRTCLAIFEGANREDFMDAIPLYMTKEDGTVGTLSYAEVEVTRSFRYVRYVSPAKSHCEVSEIAFYGSPGEGSDDKLYQITNLPVVVVHVEGNKEPADKIHDIPAFISIISKDGEKILSEEGSIRLRGNFSMNFSKKPYRIKFSKKHHVLKSPAKAKKWTLINNQGDKTLLRNILAFEISRRFRMIYTPFCKPVDVIVNGEYKGCYQLCDQVEVHKDRVEVEEMDSTSVAGDDLTGGYLVEIDEHAQEEPSWFRTSRNIPVTIKYPDDDDILPEQKTYISDFFGSMENSLYASDFLDYDTGYSQKLDIESFLRHFLIGEFTGNTDTYWSVYMTKRRNDNHLYTGPVWDFDLAFENDNRTYPICNMNDFIYATKGSCTGNMRSFVNRIVKDDPTTSITLKELWAQLRISRAVSESSLHSFLDEQADDLYQSQDLNFKRWDFLMHNYVHQNPVIWDSYEAEIKNVRDYLSRRIEWMDKKFEFDTTFLENKTYSVVVPDYGYTTLYCEQPVSIPADATAYVASELDNGIISLEQVSDVIPACTGVLINATPGIYSFETTEYVPYVGNLLKGVAADTEIAPSSVYTLGNVDGRVGFYLNESNRLQANSAYLPKSDTSAYIAIENTDDIEKIESVAAFEIIYDVMGQRRNSLQKGINIWNGRRVLIDNTYF